MSWRYFTCDDHSHLANIAQVPKKLKNGMEYQDYII